MLGGAEGKWIGLYMYGKTREDIIADVKAIEDGTHKEIASIDYNGAGGICKIEFYACEWSNDDDEDGGVCVPDTVPPHWRK